MNPYFEQMILAASPVELIRLLYRKAIASVRDAREHLRNARIEARCASINNAYAVLMELISSLRADDAPELTKKLNDLYVYMQGRLVEANMKQLDEPLAEVIALLTTLEEAWNSVPDPFVAEATARNPWQAQGTSPAGPGGGAVEGAWRVAVSA